MIPLDALIELDRNSNVPIYQQVVNAIIRHILSGRLRRGLKLPGSRLLASSLKIHRKTLQTALDELLAQGWMEIVPRKGTFVTTNIPELKPVKISKELSNGYPLKTNFKLGSPFLETFPPLDFQHTRNLLVFDGFPDIRLAPMKDLMRELRSIEKRGEFKKYYRYGNSQGANYLRETLAVFLNDTRGLSITPENILITNGAQMGLYISSNLLIRPGDHVIVGDPGYVTATMTFQRAGAVIYRVPVDDYGIDADAIEKLCKRKRIRFAYLIPHHHHPTTVTLSLERRIRLMELASKYRFAILEDDYDYDFHYTGSPILPMASLDQVGNVIYIGTLSKTLVPAVRIGFIVAPKDFIVQATAIRRSIDLQGDSLLEVSIAELYRSGTIASHLRKTVNIYRERRDHFCDMLCKELKDKVSFSIPDGGMSVWVKFHQCDLARIAPRAFKLGLTMSDGVIYHTLAQRNASRLGFSSLNFQEQERAISILKRCI